MSISVKNLSKNYGSQKAVNGISFTLDKAEIVGFLGPNGAGKSTTMKMITGYLDIDNGSIEVCGLPVNENSIETKKKIGYLPEANPLYTEMYVREYLGFVANVHKVKNAKERIETVIKTVGLVPEAHKKTGQLSKGYKQRVGLAAALVHDPEVLILDEPTSGLDPNQIIEIRNVIRSLGAHKTILFSSHIMQEVEAICDRVIIIHKGNIVADDSIKKLRNSTAESHLVLVEFKEAVNESVLKSLTNFTNITSTQSANKAASTHWKIQTTETENIRRQLLELSLKNNLNIVSLQSESQNLEEIFRTLTQS